MWHDINAHHGNSGGVYVLKCFDEFKTSNPKSIARLLENDEGGVLYIGQASCFLTRVAELKKSISPDYTSNSHECGSRYKSNQRIAETFPFETLYLELTSCDAPRAKESQLLQIYESRFGELPPLNRCS